MIMAESSPAESGSVDGATDGIVPWVGVGEGREEGGGTSIHTDTHIIRCTRTSSGWEQGWSYVNIQKHWQNYAHKKNLCM